jgi:hypothetical protein
VKFVEINALKDMNSHGMKVEMTSEDYNLNVTRVKILF